MITLEQVSKFFGHIKAADRVSLKLGAAETLAILGPSGSGKSTLLRLIAGLEIPDEGRIYLDHTLASQPGWVLAPHRRGLGFMFQTPALWPHLTVAQNIRFGLYGQPPEAARTRLGEIMAQTRVSALANRYPAQLSGGEARRVALARTLAPRVFLMSTTC